MGMTTKDAVKAAAKLGISITGLLAPKANLPKTKLGGLVDTLHSLREQRLAVDKVAQALKDEETRITNHIIDNLDSAIEGGAVGKTYKAVIMRESIPQVADWDAFYAHVHKKKAFDLLNRALNRSAVKARWEEGVTLPGVESFQAKKLSVTKV